MNDCIDRLIDAARQAPSADNSQPWRLLRIPRGLRVEFDDRRSVGGFGPRDPATLLAMGMLIENVLAAADEADIGLHAQVNAGFGRPAWYLNALIEGCPDEVVDVPRRHPLWHRHTNRFGFRKTPLPTAVLAGLSALSGDCTRVRIIQDPESIRVVAGLVARASRLRFRIREVHEWLAQSLRLSCAEAARGDGLDVATLDLPPGGSLLLRLISDWPRMQRLNHLGMYRLLATVDARPLATAPALVVLTSDGEDDAMLAAGRSLANVWYQLQAAGIGVHPYYVIPDMLERLRNDGIPLPLLHEASALRTDTNRALAIADGERLMMVLRVGIPKRDPPRSGRLTNAVLVTSANR